MLWTKVKRREWEKEQIDAASHHAWMMIEHGPGVMILWTPSSVPKPGKKEKTNYPSANCWNKKKTKKQTLCIAAPMRKGTNKQTNEQTNKRIWKTLPPLPRCNVPVTLKNLWTKTPAFLVSEQLFGWPANATFL